MSYSSSKLKGSLAVVSSRVGSFIQSWYFATCSFLKQTER